MEDVPARCAADLAPARPRTSNCVASHASRSQRDPAGRGPRSAGRRKSQERRSIASVWPQAEAPEASCPAPPVSGQSVRPGSVVERRHGRACRLIAITSSVRRSRILFLLDVPDALSIGQRGREQPGAVSRCTAGNQRRTTRSASPQPVRGASPAPRPTPPTCAEHVRQGLPRPDESRFPLVSSARSRPPVT
jgi:hypothetical protein